MANIPEFRVPLDQKPAGWDTLTDSLKEKVHYDDANKKLILIGCLTEAERKALCDVSPQDEAYQDAIKYLFWKSKSPPDNLKIKERDDKDFVTEELARMNPWVHRLLAAWLIIIGIGSIVVMICLWPNLKNANVKQDSTALNSQKNEFKPPYKPLENLNFYDSVRQKITPKISYKSRIKNCLCRAGDQVMFILAFLAGVIGSATHGVSSLMDFRGNRRLFRSWSLWYFGLPILGGMVAIIFYISVRAGFIVGSNGTENINPFGIAAVSVMVGLFTDKATTKLAEVFDTMFKTTTKSREGSLDPSSVKEKTKQ